MLCYYVLCCVGVLLCVCAVSYYVMCCVLLCVCCYCVCPCWRVPVCAWRAFTHSNRTQPLSSAPGGGSRCWGALSRPLSDVDPWNRPFSAAPPAHRASRTLRRTHCSAGRAGPLRQHWAHSMLPGPAQPRVYTHVCTCMITHRLVHGKDSPWAWGAAFERPNGSTRARKPLRQAADGEAPCYLTVSSSRWA